MSIILQQEIEEIKKKLLSLSTSVEQMVHDSVRALIERNSELVKKVTEKDREIDLKEVEIEEDCLKVLALHQPVAIDLRYLISVLKINNDLERVGDLAVNIAERAQFLNDRVPLQTPLDFKPMVQKTAQMFRMSLDSLIQKSVSMARQVRLDDDLVDQMNRNHYEQLYAEMKNNPKDVESYVHYMSISKHLERMADYATNIAEDVLYMIEGKIVRHERQQ